VELVRRQKLREEYAILWIATSIVLMALALNSDILGWLSDLAQAESRLSILFFGAHVFLILVALQFSVRLTKLTFRTKTMSQRMALLENELTRVTRLLEEIRAGDHPPSEPTELESKAHEH
jgi:Tfp pilus assembly protein PilN